jgi:hypothetical protein
MTSARAALSLLLGLAIAAPLPAAGRSTPNPAGRVVIPPTRNEQSPPTSAAISSAVEIPSLLAPAPLPSGAVQIDSTWYDLQDMGSLGSHLVIGTDNRIHATWQDDFCALDGGGCPPNLNLPNPHPQRGMAYAIRATNGTWARLGKAADPGIRGCCVTEVFGGFGSLDVTSDGRAAIAQHMNEDGCDLRGDLYLENSPGGSTFKAYLTPITDPSYLFPQVVAHSNGSFVICGEHPRAGNYDEVEEFRVSRLASAGATFVCPVGWQSGPWLPVATPSLFRDGRPAFPALDRGADGRVGIAVGDFGGNVFLFESSNGTFAAGTITTTAITQYTDATITSPDASSQAFRPYVNCHLAYQGNVAHVVWSELQARRNAATISYADHKSRIQHWDPVHGISTVVQVAPGVADRYDDLDSGGTGPLAGFNTISVDWPQVGFSDNGQEVIVAWLRFTDAEVDPTANAGLPGLVTGIGYGDIACSVSHSAGPWSAAQNLTHTPRTDERFFSLAKRNPGGKAHVLFQASSTDQAGVALIGDRGTAPGNLLRRIAYLERPLDAVTDAPAPELATALTVVPSVGRSAFRFSLPHPSPSAVELRVHALDGRLVAHLVAGTDGVAHWDGRDRFGRRVASGVYLAHAPRANGTARCKFTVLR